jgi:HemY protein
LFFLVVFILAFLSVWLADHPGNVSIDFQSYRINTSFAVLTGLAAALVFLSGSIVWLVGYLRRETPIFGSNRAVKRQSRGLKLLNQSLVALSAGDHKLASKLVVQAEVLLPPQPMVYLVAAEAASRAGRRDEAVSRYKELEKMDDGKLLGIRGLLGEARENGRENEALRLARLAFEENRKSPWVLKTLFALEITAGNWPEAEAALEKVAKENLLDKSVVTRHKGAIVYAKAMENSLKGDTSTAQKGFKQALKLRPEFAPAAIGLAHIEINAGNKVKAEKLILNAWQVAPRPSLLTLFKEIDAHESKENWVQRVQKLTTQNPQKELSILALANAQFDIGDIGSAQKTLDVTKVGSRSADTVRLALKIKRANGENPLNLENELATASSSAVWQCEDCYNTEETWSLLCNSCKGFDTFHWHERIPQNTGLPRESDQKTIALLSE